MHLSKAISRAMRYLLYACCTAATAVCAQTYPAKPITLVVPFPPGGGSDLMGRLIADGLAPRLGQQVVVENRGGAGGSIGTGVVANATPDGYTLVLASTSEIAINPSLYPDLKYDTLKDLTPVAMVGTTPMVVAVNPELKVADLKQLVELARSQPGKINVASAGTGTITHLSGDLFRSINNLEWVHVPYKGTAPALSDLMGNMVSVMFVPPPATLGPAAAGRIKLIAVSGDTRIPALPDVPTVSESGISNYSVNNWYGLFAPAGTPEAVLNTLSSAVADALKDKKVLDTLAKQGGEAGKLDRKQFSAYVADEVAKWGKVAKQAGVKPQ